MSMSKLTAKQAAFVREYVKDYNATQAAQRAGYSKRTARVVGAENLTKPAVKMALAAKAEKIGAKADLQAEEFLHATADMARQSMGDFLDVAEDGQVRIDLAKAHRLGKLHLIKKVKQKVLMVGDPDDGLPIQETEIELHDKRASLDMMLRHFGLYKNATGDLAGVILDLSNLSDEQLLALREASK